MADNNFKFSPDALAALEQQIEGVMDGRACTYMLMKFDTDQGERSMGLFIAREEVAEQIAVFLSDLYSPKLVVEGSDRAIEEAY